MTASNATATGRASRFSPEVIIACGCLIAVLTFGPRSAMGAFQRDILTDNNWTRDIFSLGLAIQNLLWGVGQPFAGAIADRFGAVRVLIAGAVLYIAGLFLMATTASAFAFDMSAGVLIGFGLSGCSFNLVLGAFGKLVPDNKKALAFGFGTAAGSLGQFLFTPLAVELIQTTGWRTTSIIFAVMMIAIIPLALPLATPPMAKDAVGAPKGQSFAQALGEAFRHPSYILLVLGFFTCGFQLAFITVHFQIYLTDAGLGPQVGGWALATIGIFNIVGSITSGWLSSRVPKRYILAVLYLVRAAGIAVFVVTPPTIVSVMLFAIVMGLSWLSTIPPTSSLVSLMFGTRYFATLYGFAFFLAPGRRLSRRAARWHYLREDAFI